MKTIRLLIIVLTICSNNCFTQHNNNHSVQNNNDVERERFYWQMPNKLFEEIGIKEGMVVADVGSGTGYITLRLSEKVGIGGKVYASDIDVHAIRLLENSISEKGLKNIETIIGTEKNPLLPKAKIDFVIMVNTIHFIDNTKTFFSNITPCLKPNSTLIIVQWDAEKMDCELKGWRGPNREQFTMRTTLKKIYDANYEVIRIKSFLPMQN
ncbi:class I SAM-dependent methyltransferase, partial [Bacteroidota bacterium]